MDPKIFDTFSEFLATLGIENDQDFNFTIHDFDELVPYTPIESQRFRANYYTFVLVKKGEGYHCVNDLCFQMKQNAFYFTIPGHLRSFAMEEPWCGFVITFTAGFLKTFGNVNGVKEFPFLINEPLPVMELKSCDFEGLFNFCDNLHKEYKNRPAYPEKVFSRYLTILLYKTKTLLQEYQVSVGLENSPTKIVMEFKRLLNENFHAIQQSMEDHIWKVSEFANRLNIEANYFGQLIKRETGQSVKAFINHKTITEAKALLVNSGQSIAEIADMLTFSDVSNFNRFFKKLEGITPRQYRELKK